MQRSKYFYVVLLCLLFSAAQLSASELRARRSSGKAVVLVQHFGESSGDDASGAEWESVALPLGLSVQQQDGSDAQSLQESQGDVDSVFLQPIVSISQPSTPRLTESPVLQQMQEQLGSQQEKLAVQQEKIDRLDERLAFLTEQFAAFKVGSNKKFNAIQKKQRELEVCQQYVCLALCLCSR